MMQPHGRRTRDRHDPDRWCYAVRRDDGTWLTRPAPVPGIGPANQDPWSRILPLSWYFDTVLEAERAAAAHGGGTFQVLPVPRHAGQWLAGKGMYAPGASRRDAA